ncbi:hypothetical protein V2G26_001785 [Clonostachys chloroleuca]
MLASGHFGNNQAGQLKVLVVLTSTDVIDKQEPATPLRPDGYSTPVKEEKKRKVKQEDTSPALNCGKRIKQEAHVKKEDSAEITDHVKKEVPIRMKPEEPVPTASCGSLTDDELESIADEIVVHEYVEELLEAADPLHDQTSDNLPGHKGSEYTVDDGDEAGGEDVTSGVPSSNHWG